MATVERQECLACTHNPHPVCDGTGVRLVRELDGQVVDVQLCPRWPASWDEPLAYVEAHARYGPALPIGVPDRIWPAVHAALARTPRLPANGTPAEGQAADDVERETVGGMRGAVFVVAVGLLVVVLIVVLAVI